MPQTIARDVRIHGRVQGVTFRASTRDRARELGVTGWVRNEPDGTVRAHLEGAPDDVEALVQWMREGPPPARVDDIEAADADEHAGERFEIR